MMFIILDRVKDTLGQIENVFLVIELTNWVSSLIIIGNKNGKLSKCLDLF